MGEGSRHTPLVNHFIIVLDSCRYDLFCEVLPKTKFFKRLGNVTRAYSNANITAPSFVEIFGHGYFPHPLPDDFPYASSGEVNFIKKRKEYKILITGMPMLWKGMISVRSAIEAFNEYHFMKDHNVCKEGVELWNQKSVEKAPIFFVLWTGETHWPYSLKGYDGTLYGSTKQYNQGKDVYKPEFFELIRRKQKEMIMYCDEVLSRSIFSHPTYVLVLADHGEAMGEDHKIGHGIYAHPIEFEVPFQCKLIFPQAK